jgi:hypothetical protein
MQPNIYLDIDGVLLTKNQQPANYANEFLRYVLGEYPDSTYWLTTRCNGDATVPVRQIGHLFEPDVLELMKKIKPTARELTAKTHSIDFNKPFLWFDDNLFYEEREALLAHDVFEDLIQVNLVKDPDQLGKFLQSFPTPVELT